MAGSLTERLRRALLEYGPVEVPGVAHCEMAVHTPAGYAFFRIVDPREDVVRSWQEVQDEIARFMRSLSARGQQEGAYLALLVEGEQDLVKLQRIASNPYVCRKVVVPHAERVDVDQLMERMPFFPLPDEAQRVLRKPPADPAVVVAGSGLTPALVDVLLAPVRDHEIKRDLLKGRFDGDSGAVVDQPVAGGNEAGQSDRFFVRQIHLSGFRNYGPTAEPIRMKGDLIIIFGRNGTGKSSMCEGLEWTVTGLSNRLELTRTNEQATLDLQPFFNLNHQDLPVAVDVLLDGPRRLALRRRWVPGAAEPRLERNGAVIRERDLLADISLLNTEESPPRISKAVKEVMQACHFLSQETVQQFLSSKPEDRYQTYRFMAGTQHIDRLVGKGERVLGLIDDDFAKVATDTGTRRELWEELWQQRRAEEERLQERLPEPIPQMEQALESGARALAANASACGLTLTVPDLPRAEAARVVAETFLAGHSERAQALSNELLHIVQLQTDAAKVPDWLAEAEAKATKVQELDIQAAEQNRILAGLEQELEQSRKEVSERQSALDQVDSRLAPAQRVIVGVDRRQELTNQLAVVEAKLPGLRSAHTAASQEVVDVRQVLAAAEADLERQRSLVTALSDRLARLERAVVQLPSWSALLAQRSQCDADLATLRTESEDVGSLLKQNQAEEQKAAKLLRERSASLKSAQSEVEARQQLLAALRGHLQPRESRCPFCGADYYEHDVLLAKAEEVLGGLPGWLQATQADFNAATEQVRLAEEASATLKATQQRLAKRRQELETESATLSDQIAAVEAMVAELGAQSLAELDQQWLSEAVAAAEAQKRAAQGLMPDAEAAVQAAQSALALAESRERAADAAVKQAVTQVSECKRLLEACELELQGAAFASRKEAVAFAQPLLSEKSELEAELARDRAGLDRLPGQVHAASQQLGGLSVRKASLAAELRSVHQLLDTYRAQLAQAGITEAESAEQCAQLAERHAKAEKQSKQLKALVTHAQRLLFEVKTYDIATEVSRLTREMEKLQETLGKNEATTRWLEGYRTKLALVIQQARDLMAGEERARLDSFKPMIQLLYQRLSAHPYFGELDLDIDPDQERLFVRFKTGEQTVDSAAVNQYFSMAQANVVALSIFLGTALLQAWSRLGFICLDDPVQHMDDMNIYALLDLLHVVSLSGRQVIITTANEDLYRLMLSRFGGMNTADTTFFQAFRLVGVTPVGPEIYEDTPRPLPPLAE